VVLGWAAVLTAAAATIAQGGFYSPPPPDVRPVWSPDGSAIVYYRFGSGLHVVSPDGAKDRLLGGVPNSLQFTFSRDWHWLALVVADSGRGRLQVMRPDGSDVRLVAPNASVVSTPSFSPDGTRIAYGASGGIWTVGVDGTSPTRLAAFGNDPTWSPDGSRIAFVSVANGHMYVVGAAGGEPADLTDALGLRAATFPSWSPDGRRLAFEVGPPQGPAIGVVELATGAARYYPGLGVAQSGPGTWSRIAWVPDGSAVYATSTATRSLPLVRVELATGASAIVSASGGSDVAVSPDGRVAYSETGECGDRAGIYAAERRITNDCRVLGTSRPDRLRSSSELYEILLGLGGNDTLIAGGAPYVGDALDGGRGNDVLRGGFWPDKLDGGSGNDTITGGPSYDTITGGAGRDVLKGEGGRDTIFARDGIHDVVDCGTNSGTNKSKEDDKVYADRLDRVSRTCEHVYRSRH
jgi:Tol biopolymer transport system component